MSDERDPFEILRALDPVDEVERATAVDSPAARATLARILAEPQPRAALRVGRRRAYALAAAAAVLAAAAGATAWALTRSPTQHLTVGCYAAADLSARTIVVSGSSAQPVRACRAVWARGELGAGSVPSLEACVLASGGIAVFPGGADGRACATLGLPPLVSGPGPTSTGGAALALKTALVDRYLAANCLPEAAATMLVRKELARLRLSGTWRVVSTAAFSPARPCASFAFDEARREVAIVPIPRTP